MPCSLPPPRCALPLVAACVLCDFDLGFLACTAQVPAKGEAGGEGGAHVKEAFDTCYNKCVAQETKDVAQERLKARAAAPRAAPCCACLAVDHFSLFLPWRTDGQRPWIQPLPLCTDCPGHFEDPCAAEAESVMERHLQRAEASANP